VFGHSLEKKREETKREILNRKRKGRWWGRSTRLSTTMIKNNHDYDLELLCFLLLELILAGVSLYWFLLPHCPISESHSIISLITICSFCFHFWHTLFIQILLVNNADTDSAEFSDWSIFNFLLNMIFFLCSFLHDFNAKWWSSMKRSFCQRKTFKSDQSTIKNQQNTKNEKTTS